MTGLPAARIGELAASASVVLHELSPQLATLEEAFMELTAGSLEYGQHAAATAAGPAGPADTPGGSDDHRTGRPGRPRPGHPGRPPCPRAGPDSGTC